MHAHVIPGILLGAALLAAAFAPAVAADIYVDDDNQTGTELGTTARPYSTVQTAIDVAANGDAVRIAAGTYVGNLRIDSKTVQLYGGYPGGSAAGYAGGSAGDFTSRDVTSLITHLMGAGGDAVLNLVEAGSSTVDGFTISGGTGSTENPYLVEGGGVYCYGGAPTISNNVIENNTTGAGVDNLGGGVFTEDADTQILGNTIRNNTSSLGGGIAVFNGTVVISANLIDSNVGIADHGGGIYAASPDLTISHNRIVGNEIGRNLGYGWGGGMIVFGFGTFATLSHNVVTGNYAPTYGSGIFIDERAVANLEHELVYANVVDASGCIAGGAVAVDGGEGFGSTVTLEHCTVAFNPSCPFSQGGDGLFVEAWSSVTVHNSIFWGHGGSDFLTGPGSTVTVTYTNSEQLPAGEGNLSSDPLFADPASGDFHLRSQVGRWSQALGQWVTDSEHSPSIDAGDPSSPFDLEPAGNGRANQGAYGNTLEASRSGAVVSLIFSDGFESGDTSFW